MNVDRLATSQAVFTTMPAPAWDSPDDTRTSPNPSATAMYVTTRAPSLGFEGPVLGLQRDQGLDWTGLI